MDSVQQCCAPSKASAQARTNECVVWKRRPQYIQHHLLALLVCFCHQVDLQMKTSPGYTRCCWLGRAAA